MADFSVDLAAPRGAGTSPVAPVQSGDTSRLLLGGISSVIDIFAKGVESDAKQKALERKNAVVGSYIRAETVINQAVATGSMSPAEAAARSRANINQYLANNAEFTKELGDAAQVMRGFTEKGVVEDKVKAQEANLKANDDFARSQGYLITPGMSEAARAAVHEVALSNKRANDDYDRFIKEQDYRMRRLGFDQAQVDREDKEKSFTLVNEIASKNIVMFNEFTTSLRGQVSSGTLQLPEARAQLASQFANIEAALQSAARLNPQLAGPYRTIFEGLRTVAEKAVDPATSASDYEEMFKQTMAKAKLAAVSADPKLLALAVGSQLLGANAQIALNASKETTAIITRLLGSSDPTITTPQVVGDPESEKDVYRVLNESIRALKTAKGVDREKGLEEAGKAYNVILQQVSELPGKTGVSPAKAAEAVKAMSSPEFAELVTKGKVNSQDLIRAKEALQVVYDPSVKRAITSSLAEVVQSRTLYDRSNFTNKPATPKKALNEMVELQFNGAGVSVVPKSGMSLDPIERRGQTNMIAAMKPVMDSFNTVLHASAHLRGGTNYEKEWKDSRHEYFPEFFTKPMDANNKADVKAEVKRNAAEDKMAEAVKLTAEDVAGPAEVTQDALRGLYKDFDKLTPDQIKQLDEALKQLGYKQ